jgi:hypothetical protein
MESIVSILRTESMRYIPRTSTSPESLKDEVCHFYWRDDWEPSPAYIRLECAAIRAEFKPPVTRGKRRKRRADDAFDPVTRQHESYRYTEEFINRVIQQSCDDIKRCIEWFEQGREVFRLLPIKTDADKDAAQITHELVLAAIHAIGWLHSDGTSEQESMGLSFNECCQYLECDLKYIRTMLFSVFRFPRRMVSAMQRYVEALEDNGDVLCAL